MKSCKNVFVDVDETLLRNVGKKQIPIVAVIRKIKFMYEKGVGLYCWSSGGADYAKESASKLGIEHCFIGYLPKPNYIVDDQSLNSWSNLVRLQRWSPKFGQYAKV